METTTAVTENKPQTILLDLSKVDLPPDARTHNSEKLESLAQDMQAQGQIQPIVVYPLTTTLSPSRGEGGGEGDSEFLTGRRFTVVVGVGRVLAARKLGWAQIRGEVKEGLSDFDKARLTYAENEEREDADPFYQASQLQKMMKSKGWSQNQLAESLGQAKSNVSVYMSLTKLSGELKQVFSRLNTPITHLSQILRLDDSQEQIKLAQDCHDKDLSVRQLKALVDQKVGVKKVKDNTAPHPLPPPLRHKALADAPTTQWRGGGRVQGGGGHYTDPLADLWLGMMSNPSVAPQGTWHVTYGPHKMPGMRTSSGNGWQFHFACPNLTPKTDLKRWFQGMADGLGDTSHEQEELDKIMERWVPQNEAEEKEMEEAGKHVRLPQNAQEEAELDVLALRGPEAVYAWIYGADSFYTKKVKGVSWQDMDIKDPAEGCRQLVANQRNVQSLDQPISTGQGNGAPDDGAAVAAA